MIIPEWSFEENNESNKIYNTKSMKQTTRENFKLDDMQLNKEISKKMNNPY